MIMQQKSNKKFSWVRICAMAAAGAIYFGSVGSAQEPKPGDTPATQKPTAITHPNNPELWDTDQMMEEAVIQISRRYNLNKDQEAYTRLLLVERTRAFLEKHETDVRDLLRESIDLKNGLKPGTPDAFQKWATRAKPLYQAAQSAIMEGNHEWRAILDPSQIKIHDADLAQMETNFNQVGKLLDTWQAGSGGAALANGPNQQQAGTAVAGGPNQSRLSDPQPPVVQKVPEDSWLAYVNRFISVYKLDDKQAISARDKVYKDMRDEATRYRESRKDEFAEVELKMKNPENAGATELTQRRAKLERPLHEMFVQLDQRLKRLPNSAQLAGADPLELKQLETWYRLLAGPLAPPKPGGSEGSIRNRPDVPTTSGPAASPKAEPATPAPAAPTTAPAAETPKS